MNMYMYIGIMCMQICVYVYIAGFVELTSLRSYYIKLCRTALPDGPVGWMWPVLCVLLGCAAAVRGGRRLGACPPMRSATCRTSLSAAAATTDSGSDPIHASMPAAFGPAERPEPYNVTSIPPL